MHDTVFRSVKRACYSGLDSVALRAAVVERLERGVQFDAFAFATADPETGLLTHQLARRIPVPMARAYAEYLYPVEFAAGIIARARRGQTVVRSGDESQEVAAVQRAHGFRDGTHVCMTSAGRVWGKLCLLRHDAANATRAPEHALLRRLVPHLTRGLQQAALIEGAVAARAGDEAATGVVALDRRGTVVLQTTSVTPMLDDLADVGVPALERIPLSIRGCAERARRGDARLARVRSRGSSGRWYDIRACVAEPNARAESVTVVTIRTMLPRERSSLLADLYGLSPREREVLTAVARGETTKEIAAALGVSPHTVKEHVDRACEKAGVRGRRELVARLFFDVYKPRLALARPG